MPPTIHMTCEITPALPAEIEAVTLGPILRQFATHT